MKSQALFHWLYVAGTAIGALHFWILSRYPRGVPQHKYLIAIFISIWSALAYMAMAIGQGSVEVAGQVIYYARYIDWAVTTPLLLLALSLTAMRFIEKDWVLIVSLMGTQFIVVTAGLIADLSGRGWTRYLWYLCGAVAFAIVLQGMWGPVRDKSKLQEPELAKLYRHLLVYVTVLWVAYPVVWIVGPSGLGLAGQTADVFLFCVLPFFSKFGFSLLDLQGLRDLKSFSNNRRTAIR